MYESPYGKRWTCYNCGAAFFDLKRERAICPKCSADQADNPRQFPIKAEPVPKPKEVEEEIVEDLDLEEEGAGDNGMESFEELEERMNEQDEDEEVM